MCKAPLTVLLQLEVGQFLGEPRAWEDHPECFSVSLEHFSASKVGLIL